MSAAEIVFVVLPVILALWLWYDFNKYRRHVAELEAQEEAHAKASAPAISIEKINDCYYAYAADGTFVGQNKSPDDLIKQMLGDKDYIKVRVLDEAVREEIKKILFAASADTDSCPTQEPEGTRQP